MNRFFGKKKKKEAEAPPPDMEEVAGRMDARMGSIQDKVWNYLHNFMIVQHLHELWYLLSGQSVRSRITWSETTGG